MARSIAQLYHQYVGKRVAVDLGQGIEVLAICSDARLAYGNEHVLVQMAAGVGSLWTATHKVRLVSDDWPIEHRLLEDRAKQVAAVYNNAKLAGAQGIPKMLEDALDSLLAHYDFTEPDAPARSAPDATAQNAKVGTDRQGPQQLTSAIP